MKNALTFLALSLMVSGLAFGSHIIDDFNSGDFGVSTNNTPLTSDQASVAGVIGSGGTPPGPRSARTDFAPSPSAASVGMNVGGGVFFTSIPSGNPPPTPTITLSYGTYSAAGTALNADLSADIALRLDVIFADQGGSLSVRLDTGTGIYTSSPTPVPHTPVPLNTLFIPFTDFGSLIGDGGLGDVDGIQYVFTGPAAWDITLDQLQSSDQIPEPATLSLLGLGALAFIRRRRK